MLPRRLSTWAGHGLGPVLGLAAVLGAALPLHAQSAPGSLPRLQVSENTRFLVTADGRPFFWLGDTAWELFHRLTREEAERYLRNRAERRFTVIQAVALAELDGLDDPNPYGERPLDRSRPDEAERALLRSTSTGSSPRPTRSGSTSGCCRRGATSGTRSGASAPRSSRRRTPPPTASGSAAAIATPASSGSSAAIGRSRATRTGPSWRRWRAACAPATAAPT